MSPFEWPISTLRVSVVTPVLSLDAVLVADLYCEFTARNAASYGVEAQPGVPGAWKLFSDAALREQLGLAPNQPTNPQAEILEDTVIPPQLLKGIYVNDHDSREWLMQRGIEADIRSEFFGPRHDYRYWQKN